jgi:hypothetical protein
MFGGDAGYRPRVRSAYYEHVYVHSPEGQVIDRPAGAAAQGASDAKRLDIEQYCGNTNACFYSKEHPFLAILSVPQQ